MTHGFIDDDGWVAPCGVEVLAASAVAAGAEMDAMSDNDERIDCEPCKALRGPKQRSLAL